MRISWSILKAWKGRNYRMVEDMIFRVPTFRSEAMQKGIDVHDYIAQNDIQVMDFFKDTTINEKDKRTKFEAKLGNDVLVGILDFYDPVEGFLGDYKVSKSSASSQDKTQLFVYNILLDLAGQKTCKDGYIVQIDPAREISDVKVLTYAKYDISNNEQLAKVYDWIKKSVVEIRDYFKKELGVEI